MLECGEFLARLSINRKIVRYAIGLAMGRTMGSPIEKSFPMVQLIPWCMPWKVKLLYSVPHIASHSARHEWGSLLYGVV